VNAPAERTHWTGGLLHLVDDLAAFAGGRVDPVYPLVVHLQCEVHDRGHAAVDQDGVKPLFVRDSKRVARYRGRVFEGGEKICIGVVGERAGPSLVRGSSRSWRIDVLMDPTLKMPRCHPREVPCRAVAKTLVYETPAAATPACRRFACPQPVSASNVSRMARSTSFEMIRGC
jgi:hypothetical protein